jgi:sortase (surface protein transpeptidase)
MEHSIPGRDAVAKPNVQRSRPQPPAAPRLKGMQVPADFGLTGWFTGGPAPGETGPAVIAGHIDSRTGPAVFYRLRELRTGDRVNVARADGTTVRFAGDSVVRYPKQAFPTEAVFGPAPEPLLRLITCGGTFDRSRGSYRDNIVITARLA